MLVMWVLFFAVIVVRFLRPVWVKNISYGWLVVAAIALHIFYGAFVTWGQYHVWAIASDFTRSLLSASLPIQAPLPGWLEWSRSFFEHPLGYFAYYVFGRIWFNLVELFVVAGFFYAIFKLWNTYRGGFLPQGPEILLILFLIAGFPGVLVLVPLSLVAAIVWFVFFSVVSFAKTKRLEFQTKSIEPVFLMLTPVALIFGNNILDKLFHILYTVIY